MHKRDGWYYIFAPAGGVATGWQTVLRSRSITGPYEDRIVLQQGESEVNGPHQGAWVDTPGGEDWFIHFQSRGLYGRITHLQPMTWGEDGWPIIGQPVEGETWGAPVDINEKPEGPVVSRQSLQASDDFAGKLGLQWQFMGNWRKDFYTLMDGTLRLYAVSQPSGSGLLWHCPNVLTQKISCPAFSAETAIDVAGLQVGEQAGFGLVGGHYAYAALRRTVEGLSLVYVQSEGDDHHEKLLQRIDVAREQIRFRMTLLPTGYDTAAMVLEYADGNEYHWVGDPFSPARHTWVGARLALFAMPLDGAAHGGYADFAPLKVTPEEGDEPQEEN